MITTGSNTRGTRSCRLRRRAWSAAICAALAANLAPAANFSVTTTDDSGPGSLREALEQASLNLEADTIDLSAISGQTIQLTSGELFTATDDIVIEGYGVTIDAGGNSRVLTNHDTFLTLNDLTLTGGSVDGNGGGIFSENRPMTLNNVSVVDNTATGVGGGVFQSVGALTINDSVISGNSAELGGGIVAAFDDLDVRNSTVSGNTASDTGGGIAALDPDRTAVLTIEASTISNNSAGQGGGGVYANLGTAVVHRSTISGNTTQGNFGGAALIVDSFATVENSTISGNTADAGAGLGIAEGEARIAFSTITDNQASGESGGLVIALAGPLLLQASIVAGNGAADDPDLAVLGTNGSDVIEAQYSLVGTAPSTGTLNNDAASAALFGDDPMLGALDDNGGTTLTHRPVPGSPALDRVPVLTLGCATLVAVDQVGNPRPGLGICDLGALEVQSSAGPTLPEAVPVHTISRSGLGLLAALAAILGFFGLRRWTAS
jgi:hypothetical protein